MTRHSEKIGQDQASAVWMQYLEQLRLRNLAKALTAEENNLASALDTLRASREQIARSIVGVNRGGTKGMHGFIAEIAEVGVGNARRSIDGLEAGYQLLNDNGPIDLIRDGVAIQQKFSAMGGRFSLGAAAHHLRMYPNYLADGGKYQIPKDHYATVLQLLKMRYDDAGVSLTKASDGPSFSDFAYVQRFFREHRLRIDDFEASQLEYHQVQSGSFEDTFAAEELSLKRRHGVRRRDVGSQHGPGLSEVAAATAGTAAIGAATRFVQAISERRRAGVALREFTEADWHQVAVHSGQGLLYGALRGSGSYTLRHFAKTSATSATAVVTASFGIAEQAHRLRRGVINETEFIENSEKLSLEATIGVMGSLIGSAVIPIPILGAVIGAGVSSVLLSIGRDSLNAREQRILHEYAEQSDDAVHLSGRQRTKHLQELQYSMDSYMDLLDLAFAPNVEQSLKHSAALARRLSIPTAQILDSPEKIRSYFLD